MKTKIFAQKIIVGSLLSIALIFSVFLFYSKSQLKNRLSEEKIKTENLLSLKLNQDKVINKYQADLNNLQSKSTALNNKIAEANLKIQNKTNEINKLKAENASLSELSVKNAELQILTKQLQNEIEQANQLLSQAVNENARTNNLLASALRENENLTNNNAILKALFSDNYRTEALRGKNEKLTVNANRTNKLMVSFDLPGNVNNNVHFTVITPEGKELSSIKDLSAIINISENGDGLLASTSKTNIGSTGTKRVEMAYKPNQKLSKGVYQFNVYNNDNFLGSTQLRLK